MTYIAERMERIETSPSSVATQRARELRAPGSDALVAGDFHPRPWAAGIPVMLLRPEEGEPYLLHTNHYEHEEQRPHNALRTAAWAL